MKRTTILFQAFEVEGDAWLAYIVMAINLIGKNILLMQPIAVDEMEMEKNRTEINANGTIRQVC